MISRVLWKSWLQKSPNHSVPKGVTFKNCYFSIDQFSNFQENTLLRCRHSNAWSSAQLSLNAQLMLKLPISEAWNWDYRRVGRRRGFSSWCILLNITIWAGWSIPFMFPFDNSERKMPNCFTVLWAYLRVTFSVGFGSEFRISHSLPLCRWITRYKALHHDCKRVDKSRDLYCMM